MNGQKIDYTVTTGTIILKEEDVEEGEKQKASIFYVAYTKENPEPNRPLTFSFNGGPGSSSVWMHLGLVGPKRVLMTEEGEPVGPPHKLVDNEFSLFDVTDLVFIDPVSTGYSRTVPKENPINTTVSARTSNRLANLFGSGPPATSVGPHPNS